MPHPKLNTLQLTPTNLQILQSLLQQHVPKAQVWAYGSRVKGCAHEGSDLDLVLRNPNDLKKVPENWLDLQEALQNSRLPLLVDLQLWSHLPESFQINIAKNHVELQSGYQ